MSDNVSEQKLGRSEARENAFLLLFEASFNNEVNLDEMLEMAAEYRDFRINEYILNCYNGVNEHLEDIDSALDKHLQGWKKSRIPRVVLCILRLAVYELTYADGEKNAENWNAVVINEAVKLAKKYETQQSSAYLNGVLGSYVRNK